MDAVQDYINTFWLSLSARATALSKISDESLTPDDRLGAIYAVEMDDYMKNIYLRLPVEEQVEIAETYKRTMDGYRAELDMPFITVDG